VKHCNLKATGRRPVVLTNVYTADFTVTAVQISSQRLRYGYLGN